MARKRSHIPYLEVHGTWVGSRGRSDPKPYLEVHCTYNLLSNCSYNLNTFHNYSYPRYNWVTVTKWVISK